MALSLDPFRILPLSSKMFGHNHRGPHVGPGWSGSITSNPNSLRTHVLRDVCNARMKIGGVHACGIQGLGACGTTDHYSGRPISHSPHLCVGWLFLIVYPASASSSSPHPPRSRAQLCHTESFTHDFCRAILHARLCHTHTHKHKHPVQWLQK